MKTSFLVFSILFSFYSSSLLEASTEETCSNECTDYHRLCPAIKDTSFQQEYTSKQANGDFPNLPQKSLPNFDCSSDEIKIVCPMSCEVCTPCSLSLMEQFQSLQTEFLEQFQNLQTQIQQIKDSSSGSGSGPINFNDIREIHVTGWQASDPWHGHTETTIDKAFEGSDDADYPKCYISETQNGGDDFAHIDIEKASVNQIKLLNRKDYANGVPWIETLEIRVCNKGGTCTFCGNPPPTAGGEWALITCQGGDIEGDQIQLVNPKHHVQFCEIKIYGTAAENNFENLQQIQVTGYQASGPWHGHPETTIDKAFDGSDDGDYKKCYISKTQNGGKDYAHIDIEAAAVSQIKLLNRKDYANGVPWIQTLEVRVCDKGGACSFCGKPPPTAAGAWTLITCEGGAIEGNQIQLVNPQHHVQFCEIKIYGTGLETNNLNNLQQIHVTGWQASDPWHGHTETTIDKAFEGSDDGDYKRCYISETQNGGDDYAHIDIEKASVSQIKLLNRKDYANGVPWIQTLEIKVCDKGGDCKFCNNPAPTAAGAWTTVTCQGGAIEGNQIQLVNPQHHVQFCEIKIYGTALENNLNNLQQLQVTGYQASGPWPGHPETTIDKAFEGSDDGNWKSCYISETQNGGDDYAHIDIEKASVSQIKLLNRKDYANGVPWIQTLEIRVCDKGGACSFCGKPAPTAAGAWTLITCQGGAIEGNQIQLANPKHHIQFCEIKIYGTVASADEE